MSDCCVGDVSRVSIVIPCLNESANIQSCLQRLQSLRALGCELIVVDGGSIDESAALAAPLAGQLLHSDAGRARQMNAGAAIAQGQWLLFLHADSCLPEDSERWLESLVAAPFSWGFFRLRLSGTHRLFRLIEAAINIRSRISSVATGGQCLFMRRELFNTLGGFADIPLMEDVEMSKRLRKTSSPYRWPTPVVTSSRRWEQHGIITTVLLMWRLRLAYFLGVSPNKLYDQYYGR